MNIEAIVALTALGIGVGALGTLIGAGGGFILVPILLLVYPQKSPELITSISLAVVFFNALSGSFAYARKKRIDYRSGLTFAAATIPGAVLGAYTVAFIPRNVFSGIFGSLLLVGSTYLLLKAKHADREHNHQQKGDTQRTLVEADGTVHEYAFNSKLGIGISTVVGYLSSLLGIGGGIIHVPAMTYLLGFPVHVATATSHFTLAFMAFAGSAVHLWNGVFAQQYQLVGILAAGVLIGAQLGAQLSDRMKGSWIVQALAIALGIVGIRILMMAF